MIFPLITFGNSYSERDKALYTFMIHSVTRECYRLFPELPLVKVVEVDTVNLTGCDCLGATYFFTDTIKLVLPVMSTQWEANANAGMIAHEYAHHYMEEKFKDHKWGNNGPHWNENKQAYFYTKRYFSPTFFFKYGLPYLSIRYHDLLKLAEQKDAIVDNILAGGGRGVNAIW